MSYTVNYKNNGFFLTHKGLVTISELHEANGCIHGHKNFDSQAYQIINLLDADFSKISEKKSIEPALTDLSASKTRPNVKVALIAKEINSINFCKGYIFESQKHDSKWEFKIFSDLQSALEWCDT